jgi:hypothetical protein
MLCLAGVENIKIMAVKQLEAKLKPKHWLSVTIKHVKQRMQCLDASSPYWEPKRKTTGGKNAGEEKLGTQAT